MFFTATWASKLACAFLFAKSRFPNENGQLVVLIATSRFETQLRESPQSVALSRPRMNEAWRGEQAAECPNVHLNKNE